MMDAVLVASEGLGGHSLAHEQRLWWFVIALFLGILLALWRFNRKQQERAENEAAEELLAREFGGDESESPSRKG